MFKLEIELPEDHPAYGKAPHVFQMPVGENKKEAATFMLPDDFRFFEALSKTLDAWKFLLVKSSKEPDYFI